MDPFDLDVLRFLNQFAHQSRTFDTAMGALTLLPIFKGWVMMAIFWWVWFDPKGPRKNREVLLATLFSAVVAVVAGRLLADLLPFRTRPLTTSGLGFVLPYGVEPDSFRTWSSFPSDHAMVFFAMSCGLWFISRALGAAAMAYVACFIALPRVYMGYHYPTDVIGGALFGILFACLANIEGVRTRLAAPALQWLDRHPASFYTCFLLFSELLATLFSSVRRLAAMIFAVG